MSGNSIVTVPRGNSGITADHCASERLCHVGDIRSIARANDTSQRRSYLAGMTFTSHKEGTMKSIAAQNVNYVGLIGPLIKAVKELDKRLETLEQRIARLERGGGTR
jgi:hypothetical protein